MAPQAAPPGGLVSRPRLPTDGKEKTEDWESAEKGSSGERRTEKDEMTSSSPFIQGVSLSPQYTRKAIRKPLISEEREREKENKERWKCISSQ